MEVVVLDVVAKVVEQGVEQGVVARVRLLQHGNRRQGRGTGSVGEGQGCGLE